MIAELSQQECPRVRELFPSTHLKLMIEGMIAGNSPARVWADDALHPASVYIWDRAHCHYFAGSSSSKAFNRSLAELLKSEIIPQALSQGRQVYKVYYTLSSWEEAAHVIMGGVLPIRAQRRLYRYERQSAPGSEYIVASGFSIVPVDSKILEGSHIGNVEEVISEISSCWSSLERFQENGFGFCVRNQQEIACWCTAEYVSKGRCGIGVETVEKYRTRGFAALATQAFVKHCLENGVVAHWDCWADNVPSVKVAESVGFTKVEDYEVLLGSFDQFEGLIIRANHLYRKGEYNESAQTHEKALQIVGEKAEPYFFYNAACVWAKAGEAERAHLNLEIAVKKGWKDLKRLESSDALESLRGSEGWKRLIAKLKM